MIQRNYPSVALAILGLGLLLWISYDASHVALTLGLETALGEAGVALLGLCISAGMLLAAAAIPLRRLSARRSTISRIPSEA